MTKGDRLKMAVNVLKGEVEFSRNMLNLKGSRETYDKYVDKIEALEYVIDLLEVGNG